MTRHSFYDDFYVEDIWRTPKSTPSTNMKSVCFAFLMACVMVAVVQGQWGGYYGGGGNYYGGHGLGGGYYGGGLIGGGLGGWDSGFGRFGGGGLLGLGRRSLGRRGYY
uniref:Uncharacterized protein n=1 Tax=Magallana gigas TaxID=29159 RepID=A0A8W8NWI2_MAGGI